MIARRNIQSQDMRLRILGFLCSFAYFSRKYARVCKIRKGKYPYALDEKGKKCYYSIMANNIEINANIAKNLIFYRKAAGLTQAELAEKINYSDKSVSKWESGNGIPDVYTLIQLAELFGITLNDLVGEETPVHTQAQLKTKGLHTLIMLLSSGIVWLVATCFFVAMQFLNPGGHWWMAFVYAVPVNAIVLIVYASIWKQRLLNFIAVTILIWTSLLCSYMTGRFVSINLGNDYEGLWTVFLVGVPLQILEVLWVFFRSLFRKNKKIKERLRTETEQTEEKDGKDGEENK